MQRRIRHLKERAAIARALNLASPSQNMTINAAASTGEVQNTRNPSDSSYLRGYKALEEEANLLARRKPDDWQLFTPDYAEKTARLRQLQKRPTPQACRNRTGLVAAERRGFYARHFHDMESILVKQTTNKPLMLCFGRPAERPDSDIFVLFRHYAAQRTIISAP